MAAGPLIPSEAKLSIVRIETDTISSVSSQGQEKEYIVRAEQEKLKKLREQLAKQRAHMDDVEAALNELGSEDGKDKK